MSVMMHIANFHIAHENTYVPPPSTFSVVGRTASRRMRVQSRFSVKSSARVHHEASKQENAGMHLNPNPTTHGRAVTPRETGKAPQNDGAWLRALLKEAQTEEAEVEVEVEPEAGTLFRDEDGDGEGAMLLPPAHDHGLSEMWYRDQLQKVKDEAYEVEATLECRISTLESFNSQLEENKEALVERVKCLEVEVHEAGACVTESRAKLDKLSEALEQAVNNARYYQARMEQEKKLSRQLISQVNELHGRRLQRAEEGVPNDGAEENDGTDRALLVQPTRSREPCIVCTEVCDHYESLPCRHPICTECYVQWFASRMYYNDTRHEGEPPVVFACPMCRTPIDTLS